MTFDPKTHIIQLPRRVKDPATGQWGTRSEEYLEVKWRLVWFREKFPHGSITTDAIMLDWENGIAIYRATVEDGEGGKATGTGTETRKGFEDFVEKAETRSIGRALASLGIGTQFVGEELSEGEHIADAPVSPPPSPPATSGHTTAAVQPAPLAEGEGTTRPPEPAQERLTQEAIDRLFELATAANEPKEVFGSRLRNLMRLSGDTRISKKFLVVSMSPTQYDAARAYYEGVIREQVESDVPDHDPPPPDMAPVPQEASEAAQVAPESTITQPPKEAPAAVPSGVGPSSATADPEADAKAALRAEVAGWALPVAESEVTYILEHYSLEKARALLWGARRQKPAPTPLEASAAD